MATLADKIRRLQRTVLDGVVRSNPRLGLEERAEGFVRLFENQIPEKSRVLDIGGGWGFYHEPLTRRGHHVTVLDVVKPGFQKAPVIVYDGQHIPFPDKSFDVSLLITVLHHIPDPETAVREARRVTRRHVVVVEDLYTHSLGKCWTALRDKIYNFEFLGHPCNFKKKEEWIHFFENGFGFRLIQEEDVYTWLAGMRIKNGVFVFELSGS